jgi:hypothetical protein
MPRVSQKKKDKIAEQILHFLFASAPDSRFVSEISEEIARDEEFVKSMLEDLEKKKLVVSIDKNRLGRIYSRRRRWRLSNEAFEVFSKHQEIHPNNQAGQSSAALDEPEQA